MLQLADFAKHLIKPANAVTTGWPSVEATCRNLRIGFDPWQADYGSYVLSKDLEGFYAASMSVLSSPRQIGKTYLLAGLTFALCLLEPGMTAIWTAHRGRTATESFRSMKAIAKRPELAPYIDQSPRGGGIRSTNGEQEIEFKNGSRILFGARDSGFGVGFANVGLLIIDEMQRATTRTMDDLLPTTNAAANPLIIGAGTPPRPTDDGSVFTMFRNEAISGESDDVCYVELGASYRFDLQDEPEFWRQLRNANPAFPHRVNERAIMRNMKGLSSDSVYRETFGLWDDVASTSSPLDAKLWARGVDVGPRDEVPPDGLAVDMSHDRRVSISACWVEGGSAHIEEVFWSDDEAAAAATVVRMWEANRRCRIIIDSMSPAASMIPALKADRVDVHVGTSGDMQRACGLMLSDLEAGRLTHGDQERLNQARADARRRPIGTAGGWGYDRRNGDAFIAPLVAASLARLAAAMVWRPTDVPSESPATTETRFRPARYRGNSVRGR